jgi:predicted AlkP superfamily pyrophosphatase or phosphodiesterase
MKKHLTIVFLCLLYARMFAVGQAVRHVILISIDGMRPEFYLDSLWPAPNLQQLAKQGAHAMHMKSVFPSYTYPSHSSMVTGAYPALHEVCYNAPFAPVASDGRWNWETSNIKARTIWDAAKEAGLTSAMVEWPVSVGAPVTWNIPEIWPVKDPGDRITETRKYSTPGLVEEIERSATGVLTRENMNEEYLSMDENSGRMAAYIFQKYKPNILAVHFAAVDGSEHEQGRYGYKVKAAVAASDKAIGGILEAIERAGLKDSTTVLIVGDHGFMDMQTVVRPNIWLAQEGLLKSGAEWGVKFQPAGGSAFLYLQHPKDTQVVDRVRKLLGRAPDSLRSMFKVIEKPELIRMGADKNAVMALAAVPGVVFGGGAEGSVTAKVKGGHHGYDPNFPEMYTGFIAAGAGIQEGMVIQELTVVDIAPLIMSLLGVDFKAPSGVLPPHLIKSP